VVEEPLGAVSALSTDRAKVKESVCAVVTRDQRCTDPPFQ